MDEEGCDYNKSANNPPANTGAKRYRTEKGLGGEVG